MTSPPATDTGSASSPTDELLAGGGAAGALMRSLDWSASPLGQPESWPQSLRSVVGLMLHSRFPMFVAWGEQLGFLYNDAYAEILGGKHPAAMGRRFQDIWSEIWPDISPLIDAAMAGAGTYRENLPLLMNRKGFEEQTWFTFSYSPVRDESGRVAGMFCACTETTDTVLALQEPMAAAEKARREADLQYRAYFENTAEALFVVNVLEDGGFSVEDLNPAHEAGIGFPLAEIRGKRLDEIMPAELADKVQSHYRHLLETGQVYEYRETFELNGEPTYWDTVLVPVRDVSGRIFRIIGSSRDLTRQLAAEEQLRQAQKMEALGQLTGGIAHDFNNLLTPIVGALDMLKRKTDDARSLRLIEGGITSAERARTLITRLLSFARKQRLEGRDISLRRLLLGTVDLLERSIGPSIRLELELPDEDLCVHVDPNQLELALLNLAVNARDAMPTGGKLKIRGAKDRVSGSHKAGLSDGDYARITVEDSGAGMDEHTLRMAVEPFYSTKDLGKGTGLGLSMVHGLAAQSNGGLAITSEIGRGTTVELWLPLGTGVPEEEIEVQDEPVGKVTPRKILLVDDEDLVRAATADMLVDVGHTVHQAHSGPSAISVFESDPTYDVLVTDYAMPLMSGAALIRRIKEIAPATPALLVTGYASATTDVPKEVPRIEKPFRAAELIRRIEELATG